MELVNLEEGNALYFQNEAETGLEVLAHFKETKELTGSYVRTVDNKQILVRFFSVRIKYAREFFNIRIETTLNPFVHICKCKFCNHGLFNNPCLCGHSCLSFGCVVCD